MHLHSKVKVVSDLRVKNKIEDSKGAHRFMSGVLLLSLSTVIVKIIGLAFKIPMLSFLGAEGMGYFNSAYEIYALLCVISTAGLPVALSMLISTARANDDARRVRRIYRSARLILGVFGACGTALMIFFSHELAEFIGNSEAYLSMMAIAPALLLVCLSSAIRGYCQGFEYMVPTALSQLIEALGKLVFGIIFSVVAISKGHPIWVVAAFAVFGISVGSFASLLYLWVAKNLKRPERSLSTLLPCGDERERSFIGELISIALPITLGSALLGLTRIIDMALIMRKLQELGASVAESNTVYGSYTTLAIPVFSLIPALITPISMALVPQLSAFAHKGDIEGEQTVIDNSVRLTVLLSMPASFGLTLFSRPILELLFAGQTEAIDISAPLLAILGSAVIFSCLVTTTNAILQSYRHVCLPIVSMSIGVLVKLVSTYFLLGMENVGVLGAPIGSLLCNITVAFINLCFMRVYTNASLKPSNVLFKPLIASCISVGGAFALYICLERYTDSLILSFCAALLFALLTYIWLSFMTGSLTKKDIMLFPFGERIVSFAEIRKNKGFAVSEEINDGGDKK